MTLDELGNMRRDYGMESLHEDKVPTSPHELSKKWLEDAIGAGLREPNAMVLSTVSRESQPSSRVVLLKGMDERGLMFFTNYVSRKGKELAVNPRAALLFFWEPLERQLRIEGRVEKLSDAESDAYFESRPMPSRISAVASPQSQRVDGREALDALWDQTRETAGNTRLHRPAFWGGYLLRPKYYEFWQGRENRLHDRIFYRLEANGWLRGRLAP